MLFPAANTLRFLTLAGLLAATVVTHGQAGDPGAGSAVELLVKRRPGTTMIRAAAPGADAQTLTQIGWERISIRSESGVEALLHDPDVVAVETNIEVTAFVLPELTRKTTGASLLHAAEEKQSGDDPFRAGQWALNRIRAEDAWRFTNGSTEIVVAAIDTGINYLHEDLAANLWTNAGEIPGNGIDDDGNGWVDDVHGVDVASDEHGNDGDPFDEGASGHRHGTMVAGIIGAARVNGRGIAGVCPEVRLMAVRAVRASNRISLADELAAMDYVLTMKRRGVNIRAVNLSYGGLPFSVAERDAIAALQDAGIVVCAAAGNDGQDTDRFAHYPSSHTLPDLISVAATDSSDRLAVFPHKNGSSNFGRRTVSLAAPGLGIFTTDGPGAADYEPEFWGTSAATPHVAGAVALLAAVNPSATPADIKAALLGSVDLVPALTNKVIARGRLNVARAMDHPRIANGSPRIVRQPDSQGLLAGQPLRLGAVVAGQQPRALQWLQSGVPVPGATNAEFILQRTLPGHTGAYQLVASNALGVVTSEVASVSFVPLAFAKPGVARVVRAGSALRLAPTLKGPGPLRYQWLFNGESIPSATNAVLKLTRLSVAHEGTYSLMAENVFGSVTEMVASLRVLERPEITLPPVTQTVLQGSSVTWSVVFTGHPSPFEVTWQRGSVVYGRENVSAGAESYFTLTNIQPAHAGSWRVTVRNAASTSGARATFKLAVMPDANGDGLPDVFHTPSPEWTNIVAQPDGDLDGDGVSNRAEIAAGTNPADAQSRLAIRDVSLESNGVMTLRFSAVSNRTYSVQMTTPHELSGPGWWQNLLSIPATRTNRDVVIRLPGVTSTDAALFRLITPRQP